MVGSETPSTSGAQLGELCCSVSFANSGFSAGLQEVAGGVRALPKGIHAQVNGRGPSLAEVWK